MVDLVAAWDRLSSAIVPPTDGRDGGAVAVVLAALKLAMPALEDEEEMDGASIHFPASNTTDGRGGSLNGTSVRQSGFQAALSVAMTLAHLKVRSVDKSWKFSPRKVLCTKCCLNAISRPTHLSVSHQIYTEQCTPCGDLMLGVTPFSRLLSLSLPRHVPAHLSRWSLQ